MDDGSTDGTRGHVRRLKDKRIKVSRTSSNKGAAWSRWRLMQQVDPNSILVFLDLDDYLVDDCLQHLNPYYDKGILATGSRYKNDKNRVAAKDAYTARQIDSNSFLIRTNFRFPPLRTFHGSLIQNLSEDDFKINGEWIKPVPTLPYFGKFFTICLPSKSPSWTR